MEAMRQSWTDEHLDDFRVDVGRRFDVVDRRFDKVDARLDQIDAKFDALLRTLMQVGFGLGIGLLGVVAALIGVIATQI